MNCKFKSVDAIIGDDGQIHLDIVLLKDDNYEVIETEFHDVVLPLVPHGNIVRCSSDYAYLELYDRKLKVLATKTNDSPGAVFWTRRIVERKPKEMTIDEIEEALGYPIKIVSGGDKE